jgi:hypothetical protein
VDRSEKLPHAIAILNIGFIHDEADEVSLRVGVDRTFTALDLLAGVEAARRAAHRGFHPLTVDDALRRARLVPRLLTRRHYQCLIDAFECAIALALTSPSRQCLRRMSPDHAVALPSHLANPKESQRVEIT